ncbi:hemicentin-2-like [Corticium candelabrum]|uniref:hemicentin-2-like n=1 Tax=Corticium candelabrum TaxID=121492 RepID=UPI002E25DFA8|nr:hemicentin-2-like [Corticium candelabrum]
MLSTTTVIFTAVCFLCGVERTQSVALVCLVQPCNNRALCPPVNCTSGTVYDSCRCCQQCGLPNGSVCDERRSPSDNGRYCAHGLVCEMNGSNVEGICKGDVKQCQHGELWNVDDSTFCGCWGGRTVCQAAKRHRHLSNITPTPAIGVFGISVSPTLNEYQSGSSVNITCEYQGYPKPILVFTYNHKIIDDRPTQTIKGEYGSTVLVATLIINELTIRDTGSYSCLVMNKAGMAETVTKHIKVRPTQIGSAGQIPVFIHPNHDYEKKESSKAIIICRAVGNPIPDVSITKNGQKIPQSDSNRLRIFQTVHAEQGEKHLILLFSKLLLSDTGMYTCTATNDEGTTTSRSHLQVTQSPFLCTFETNTCGWSVIQDRSEIPWRRVKASEVSSHNGPSKDSTRNDSNGHFLYLRNSSHGGQVAVIENIMTMNVCRVWLRFIVHGDNTTRLKVMMRSNGEKTLLTDYIGKASNKWVKRLIPLTEQVERLRKLEKPQTLRLQILGKLGRGHKHYIAIDDIQYEKCPGRRRKRQLFR